MNKEEIKEYLKRVEKLELKLTGEDKDTLQWLIYGYNQCAKLLNETEQENIQLKIQLLEKKCSDKDVEYKEKIKLQAKVNQLEDNWNELKEYIRKTKIKEFEKAFGKRYGKTFTQAEIIVCNMLIEKMKELEGGSNE